MSESNPEWTRWADEGGKQVRFTQLPNGSIKVAILNCDGTLQGTTVCDEVTLANFRVAQLPDWIQPKLNQLEAHLAAAKALIALVRRYVEAYRMIEQIDHDFDTAGPEYDEPNGEVYGKRYSDLIHGRALARQDAEESMIACYDAYALLLEAKAGETP